MENISEYLNVRILTPQSILFNGQATSLSSVNSVGPFDILAEHANFITLTENSDIIIRTTNGEEVKFNFPLAIIYTIHNNITIYTSIQLPQLES